MTEAKAPNVTQMTAPAPATSKMVKMKVNHPCRIGTGNDERIAQPGDVIEVTEAEAVQLEIVFKGGYSLSGDVGQDQAEASRHMYKRAHRI